MHTIDDLLIEDNLKYSTLSPSGTPVVTSLNGTLNLAVASTSVQVITGTATGFSIVLPNATTLTTYWKYEIWNQSSQPITLKYNNGATDVAIPAASFIHLTLADNTTQNGQWMQFRAFTGTATGLLNYTATSSASFSASGTGDQLITSMSIIPVPGTYAIWYDGSIQVIGNGNTIVTSIYNGTTQITDSVRTIAASTSTFNTTHQSKTISQFNGTNACEAHMSKSGSSATITGRSLILMRLGD